MDIKTLKNKKRINKNKNIHFSIIKKNVKGLFVCTYCL